MSVHVYTLENGLTLLVEPMAHVQSAALSILTPAGVIYEPQGANGTAAALCDWIMRGAGTRDSRQLIGALDGLGVEAHEHTGWNFLSFSAATIASKLLPALELYGDILQRPQLPESQFEAVLSGVEQNLLAMEDEPQRLVFVELKKRVFPDPWGRSSDGSLDELEQVSPAQVSSHFQQNVRPNGTLIGVAGKVDPKEVLQAVQRIFGAWTPQPEPQITATPPALEDNFLEYHSTQTHIGISYPAVPYGHPDYYAAWGAIDVLSGGSSSRLFTEVREKRGLCYSVDASLNSLLHSGCVLAYAGTTTDRAQETVDVMLEVIRGLGNGIGEDELTRCKARAKSSLIMQQESTQSRSGSIVRDWFHLGRVQTLEEIRQKLDALTVQDLLSYVHRYPASPLQGFCVGEKSLVFG